MAALDLNFYFTTMNKAFIHSFTKIFATRVKENSNFLLILSDFPELKNKMLLAYNKALIGQKNQVIIENDSKKDDAYYCYEVYFDPLNNIQKNTVLGVIITIKNISDYQLKQRHRLHQHTILARAEKRYAITEITTALAHEINQPLAAINVYSYSCFEKLKNNTLIDKKVLEGLEQIVSLTKHAGDILHRMKSFMRYGEICSEAADINSVIKQALTFLEHHKKDLKFSVFLDLCDSLPTLYLDKVKMTQIILNLAHNSIEAFQGQDCSLLNINITTLQKENQIEVHFQDNGPGISSDICNKIMKSYFSTKKSTGLGLHICRNLIQAHGGKLIIQKSTQGAHLYFTLPLKLTNKPPEIS